VVGHPGNYTPALGKRLLIPGDTSQPRVNLPKREHGARNYRGCVVPMDEGEESIQGETTPRKNVLENAKEWGRSLGWTSI